MSPLILTIPSAPSPPPPSSPIQKSSPWYNLLQSLFTTYDRLSLSAVYISTNTSNPSIIQLNIPLQVTPSTPNPAPLLPVINPLLSTLTSTAVSEIATIIINTPLPPIARLPAPRTDLSPYTEFVTLRRPAATADGDVSLLHTLLDQGAEIIIGSLSAEERARKPVLGRSCAFVPEAEGGAGGEENVNERLWACYVEWASPEGKAELMRVQKERGGSWDGMLEAWGAERSFWKVREVRRDEVEMRGKEGKGVFGKVKRMLRW